jgi:nucleoside phosphorylase
VLIMSPERVDVLIVVALRPELDAVLAQAKEGRVGWREARDSTGATYYVRDEINARGQSMRIAAAWLGESGEKAATIWSRRLADELDPACLAMCGVCSGRREIVQLGDVVVAARVVDADKIASETPPTYEVDRAWKMDATELANDAAWKATVSSSRPPSLAAQERWLLHALFDQGMQVAAKRADRKWRCPNWEDAVRLALKQSDVQANADGELELTLNGFSKVKADRIFHPDGVPEDRPFRVHVGTIATTTSVVQDPAHWNELAARVNALHGMDFEATAIASVAAHLGRRWLLAKGVVVYADSTNDVSLYDFACRASAAFLWTFLHRYFDVGDRAKPPSDRPEDQALEPLTLERLSITGFKNIAEIELDLSTESKLAGRWTCLAGINGSGKTSILQAIALALLGDRLSEQLGSVRLARMVRKSSDGTELAEITATVRAGVETQTLSVPLSSEGINSDRLASYASIREMRALWEKRARRGILAAYGASRNLSEYLDNRHESLHLEVQRQMTLFDPQARVARAGLLLSEDPHVTPVIGTLRRVLETVLADLPVKVAADERALRFEIDGAVLPASALPDGFRSTVAWLGDLCALWHEKAPQDDVGDGDPSRIHGIVLIDEIDLHLHPSLQRVLVPRLRTAMPRVQWIVTTHSPLVLASFDRHEIKMLDSTQPGGVRELDRDILGFTTDQIYEWLMGTKPRGVVLDQMLAEAAQGEVDPARRDEIAAIVATAPDFDEADAKKRLAWRRGLLERVRQNPGAFARSEPAAPDASSQPAESEKHASDEKG